MLNIEQLIRLPDEELIAMQIWAEGYAVSGNSSGPNLLGEIDAPTLKEACDKLAKADLGFAEYYDPATMRYWGCRLFDNYDDAAKAFTGYWTP